MLFLRIGRRKVFSFGENVVRDLNSRINEKEYQPTHVVGKGSFSRRRKLTFKQLVVFLMNVVTRSLQKELNHYYKLIQSGQFDIQQISKSAFTQARAKLSHTAFVDLSDMLVEKFYKDAPYMTWLGRRLLAVDGSTLQLPESGSLRAVYSSHKFGSGERERLVARISHLYDPLNQITLHSTIDSYTTSEKAQCFTHLDSMKAGDVVLFDRYYPSVSLFLMLQSKQVDFVARLNEKWWTVARKLLAGLGNEAIVKLKANPNHDGQLSERGIQERTIRCRIMRYTLPNGEKMVLCTSLLDRQAYSRRKILAAYNKRWGIEESFKFFKCRLDMENFTGKTPHAVLQDFHAKIFLSNLCTALMLEDQIKLEESQQANAFKHKYQLNRSFVLSTFKDLPVFMFLKRKLRQAIVAFRSIISRSLSPIRPKRKFRRRPSQRKMSKMNYKPV